MDGGKVELIGTGRTADIYALDEHRVLRRYRSGEPADAEARVMTYVRDSGYPAPEIFDCSGPDLVMERLHGPTMFAAMTRRPWLISAYGRQLAALHTRLHGIAAPGWLGDGQVLHLDLHPLNVLLTPYGPRVIDWCNARGGDPALDVATTFVTMSVAEVPHLVARAGRGAFVRAFLAASRTDPLPKIAEACLARIGDPHTTPAEFTRLRGMMARYDVQPQ
ncbi:phosphotransferase [Nonomuraea sp. NPDC050556]|uniref:phosphotransferase n=1 Tax=Nonomuraea sp. NPDC050556 TaxID=3364369 RepID=UPI00379BD23E